MKFSISARVPALTVVILLDISAQDYSFSSLENDWHNLLSGRRCPNCGEAGRFARHAVYCKYHFRTQVEILRVRCARCRVTHALIPSFSLPGTSLGCEEVEVYLSARDQGLGRAKAAHVSTLQAMEEHGAKRLERMLTVAVSQGKALLAGMGDPVAMGLGWIVSVCGENDRPLYRITCLGLQHGVNGLCFCRRWLLHYCRAQGGGHHSHNLSTPSGPPSVVESG